MDDAGRHDVEELRLEPVTVVRSRRPRALWGVLAAVGLAAGALVVISANDDGGTRPGLPVALGSASPEEAGAAADSMMAWITYVAGDDLPALGGEAPAYRLRGNVDEAAVRALADALGVAGELVHDGPAWTVAGEGGTLEVYEGGAQWWYSSEFYEESAAGSGSSSGSAGGGLACPESGDDVVVDCGVTTMTTYPECTASDGSAGCITGECPPNTECVVPDTVPPDVECDLTDGCAEPLPVPVEPPADLPSEDEARAIALELLAATGFDVDGADVTVDRPYDAWYVTVEPRVDGLLSGLLASASVGSGGEVTSAGGYLGDPERLGDYPLLDTRAAIDRANAQQAEGGWFAYSPRGGMAMDTGVATAEAPMSAASCAAEPGTTATTECEDTFSVEVPTTPTTYPCQIQPDGAEICDTVEPGITCPQVAAPADEPLGAPETIECTPPPPEPGPAPEPLEVVLVDVERSLVLLGAIDGSTDAYLVPAYRFTGADGGRVDLPAVADEALTGPPSTTVPDMVDPPATDGGVDPVDPQPCGDVLVEEDASGTTHTVPPNPDCVEPATLPAGEDPQLGIGYYVDVQVMDEHCTWISVEVAGRWWWAELPSGALAGWSTPTEGGTFTLLEPDRAEFVGDEARTKVAELVVWEDGTEPPLCV